LQVYLVGQDRGEDEGADGADEFHRRLTLAAAGIEFDGAFDDDMQEVGRIAFADQGDAGGE